MSAVAFVRAAVFALNHVFYNASAPRDMQVPCEGSTVLGTVWWNPQVADGILYGYAPTLVEAEAAADSVKTIKLRAADGNLYHIAIDNGDDVADFVANCNACCGATPDMYTGLTLAAPIIEDPVPLDSAGDEEDIFFGVPPNPWTRDYLISEISYNGGTIPFTPAAGGYANLAAVITALNTSASAVGVWSSVNAGKTIKLVPASGITSVSLDIDIEAAKFCLDLPAVAVTVEVLRVKDAADANVDQTIPALVLSEANRAGVLAALTPYFPNGTLGLVDVGAGDWKLNYEGPQKPVGVLSADLTTVNVSFTAGVCA